MHIVEQQQDYRSGKLSFLSRSWGSNQNRHQQTNCLFVKFYRTRGKNHDFLSYSNTYYQDLNCVEPVHIDQKLLLSKSMNKQNCVSYLGLKHGSSWWQYSRAFARFFSFSSSVILMYLFLLFLNMCARGIISCSTYPQSCMHQQEDEDELHNIHESYYK